MPALHPVSETPHRAIIYIRQSIKREESISLELQESVSREYCARRGYVVADVVPDRITGQKWEKRPGVQEVMRRVLAGEVDRVIIYRWSRISRVRLHQAQAIHLIEQAGAVAESATEPFDTKTAAGEFGRDMMLDFAVFQGKLIGEQWREAHDRRRNNGLPHCGGQRYGYTYLGGRYEIDPGEAEIVRWMYCEYISGRGFNSLSAALNKRGVPNKRGRQWHYSTLTRYMDSGFAAGKVWQWIGRSQPIYLDGTHDSIIKSETWDSYLRVRRGRVDMPPQTIEPRYPLAALIRCGDCGSAMHSCKGGSGKTGHTYQCGRWRATGTGRCVTITRARAEGKVLDWLRDYAIDIEAAATADTASERVRVRSRADVDVLEKQIREVDRQLKELRRHLLEDRIDESEYEEDAGDLKAQRESLRERQQVATRDAEAMPAHPVRRIALQLIEHWDILPVAERRELLRKLIRRVEIHPAEKRYGRASVLVVPVWAPPDD
jgi:site-specific DNA recombinase